MPAIFQADAEFTRDIEARLVGEAHAGLDRAQAVDLLANGSPGSLFLRLASGRMVAGDETVHFMLKLMAKDLTYAKAEGEALGVDMATATAALSQIETGVAKGFGDGDISGLYKALKS